MNNLSNYNNVNYNEFIESYCRDLASKRVAVLGVGISNLPLIRFLHGLGVSYIRAVDKGGATDVSRAEVLKKVQDLQAEGVIQDYRVGDDYLSEIWEGVDIIFKTPVVRFDIPELCVARERGVKVTSEMEEFMHVCPAKIFAITGSDGKTTTTTLTYKILAEHYKDSGVKVWVGGNIGTPLFQYIRDIKPCDKVVLELSSFQLMNASVRPQVSVVTNISPNHLDVHKDYNEYIEAKKAIFQNQASLEGDVTVLNLDNEVTASFATDGIHGFSYGRPVFRGAYFLDGNIYYAYGEDKAAEFIMPASSVKIPGKHNIENYLAVISAVFEDIYGNTAAIKTVAENFGGVEHRLEFVRELCGVKFYNSSIDSSPNRTIKALSVFSARNVVMIAGGKDKKIPYDEIGAPIAEKVKVLILTGPTAEKIETAVLAHFASLGKHCDIKIIHCTTYEEAVNKAYANATSGDNVLLSPASTSFDMFRNFEERGNVFKELVKRLEV